MEILIGIAIGVGITILTGKMLGFERKGSDLPTGGGIVYNKDTKETEDSNTPKDNR